MYIFADQTPCLAISHATAEAEWNRRLEHFTKGPEGPHAGADVEELFALLRSMLIIDPTRRPSAEEVLKHPWFSHDETFGPMPC
jgi:serine/threonine-protein kinase SRPK3